MWVVWGRGVMRTRFLCEDLREKSAIWRPRRRCEYNIKTDIQDVGWRRGLERSFSGQGLAEGFFEQGNDLPIFLKCWKFIDQNLAPWNEWVI